ncbi:HEAT repeat domain-containing protein [Methanobrevibacter millerae]|uniref:HEAT repeat-containing protein n=1 Tax=Methanobrevibacter millerae TaxID=230361 RepID=A0A1G5VJL2_9EURY|nr:HEAT repeat domain-containing protein [Methanobrevibacter millerae]SDA46010.1 hypothetical protein SAMN02910315_00676 [Methanobrevibacter millerae]
MNDKEIINQLRQLTKSKEYWKDNIDEVASKLDDGYSDTVKAKALWLLGEMGLKYPLEMESHVDEIAFFMEDENPKLRERSLNALGRIGRADKNLVISYMNRLMEMRDDESGNVRHAFVWACENIATTSPELFCDKLEIFYDMINDSSEKVRIEAPEMFRVVGKRKPDCVKPFLTKLEWISKNDEHPAVRVHCAGAVRITNNALNINM